MRVYCVYAGKELYIYIFDTVRRQYTASSKVSNSKLIFMDSYGTYQSKILCRVLDSIDFYGKMDDLHWKKTHLADGFLVLTIPNRPIEAGTGKIRNAVAVSENFTPKRKGSVFFRKANDINCWVFSGQPMSRQTKCGPVPIHNFFITYSFRWDDKDAIFMAFTNFHQNIICPFFNGYKLGSHVILCFYSIAI